MRSLMFGLLALTPACADAQFPASWTQPVEPFRIAEELYYVGTAGLSAFLFTSDEGHILIDAPMPENVGLVLDNIRRLGFDPKDIRVHLASHAHFDHVGGFADMIAATGGELAVSRADAEFVRTGRNFGVEDGPGYPAAAPTRILEHLDTVRVGPLALTAHLTPGHTPGCTTWSGTVRIGGEALEFVSVCSLSVLASYRLLGENATYPGQAADYCRSVAYLRTLHPDIFLGPHSQWFDMAEKRSALSAGNERAFVDPDQFHAYVDSAASRIDGALARQGHEGGCASLLR
jgi:metallo-beta-lactamase class B